MGKLINKQDTIDKIKKETLINYSVAVMAELRNVLNRKMHQFMKEIRKLTNGCVYQM
jgi:ribosomal protein L10